MAAPTYKRPSFVEEADWERASEAEQHDWHNYAKDLAELCEDPRFRSVTGRWLDELHGVFRAAFDPAEAQLAGHATLLAVREGRRQPGIEIMQHMQAVAPKMWMRGLQEMKNARVRAEQAAPPAEE